MTLVVVTHDDHVAHRAERIVTLRDGVILSDEPVRERALLTPIANRANALAAGDGQPMKVLRHFAVALDSIRANKLRSSLTMLGIIIGVAAVLTTMGIGKGAAASITEQIESQGTNLLSVSPTGGSFHSTMGDAEALSRTVFKPHPACSRSSRVYGQRHLDQRVERKPDASGGRAAGVCAGAQPRGGGRPLFSEEETEANLRARRAGRYGCRGPFCRGGGGAEPAGAHQRAVPGRRRAQGERQRRPADPTAARAHRRRPGPAFQRRATAATTRSPP